MDVHPENIFVREASPTQVVAVIDWQSTTIAPLFDHTIFPAFLNCDGPNAVGLERPPPPDLPGNTDAAERIAAWNRYEEHTIAIGCKHLLRKAIRLAFDALMFQKSEPFNVLSACRYIPNNGEAYCLGSVAALEGSPVQYSDSEKAEIEKDVVDTSASVQAMDAIRKAKSPLFPEKGLVRPEDYKASKLAERDAKEQVLKEFAKPPQDRQAWDEAWPFDD